MSTEAPPRSRKCLPFRNTLRTGLRAKQSGTRAGVLVDARAGSTRSRLRTLRCAPAANSRVESFRTIKPSSIEVTGCAECRFGLGRLAQTLAEGDEVVEV